MHRIKLDMPLTKHGVQHLCSQMQPFQRGPFLRQEGLIKQMHLWLRMQDFLPRLRSMILPNSCRLVSDAMPKIIKSAQILMSSHDIVTVSLVTAVVAHCCSMPFPASGPMECFQSQGMAERNVSRPWTDEEGSY